MNYLNNFSRLLDVKAIGHLSPGMGVGKGDLMEALD